MRNVCECVHFLRKVESTHARMQSKNEKNDWKNNFIQSSEYNMEVKVGHTLSSLHQEAPLYEEQHPHEPVCLLHPESCVHPCKRRAADCHVGLQEQQ